MKHRKKYFRKNFGSIILDNDLTEIWTIVILPESWEVYFFLCPSLEVQAVRDYNCVTVIRTLPFNL